MTADASARPPGDDRFKQSMADFARRLGERDKGKPAPDPVSAAERRQAALRAHDRVRLRRGILMGSGVLAAASLVTLGILMLTGTHAPNRAAVREHLTVARAEAAEPKARPALFDPPVPAAPATPPKVEFARADKPASVPPAPAVSPPPDKPPEVTTAEVRQSTSPPAPSDQAAPPQPAPNYLKRDEVREVQQRLWRFGIDPGPADGSAGARTQAAALQYREKRGLLPAVDTVDYALLDALRQDPAPPVAHRPPPAQAAYSAHRRPPPRSNNPFDQLAAWFQSIGR